MTKFLIVPKEHTRLAAYEVEADTASVETIFVYFTTKHFEDNAYVKKFVHAISIDDITSFSRIEEQCQ